MPDEKKDKLSSPFEVRLSVRWEAPNGKNEQAYFYH
jgi:hypothetical protein